MRANGVEAAIARYRETVFKKRCAQFRLSASFFVTGGTHTLLQLQDKEVGIRKEVSGAKEVNFSNLASVIK